MNRQPIRTSLLLILLGGGVQPLHATIQDDSWDDARSVALIRATIEARQAQREDSFQRFSAYAEGQVHYLAEYGTEEGDQAVRSDRIALEVGWERGVGSRQRIVGRRTVSWIPMDIRYHIDHLSLVMENFGDRIQIGDGDEVSDVLSPVAPGAPAMYEFRLADSLSIRIDGRLTELYRVEVRPRDPESPGVVGTLDIVRGVHAVARIAVTFTPVSYVDPTVRSVSVDLQNALVANRVWLPAVQHVEVRRQVRFLDLPVGGTIRTSFRVLEWDLDPPRDERIRRGHRVESAGAYELARYMGWRLEVADGAPELLRADSALFEEVRSEATRVAMGRYLGGSSRLRLYVPSGSALLRARRAEGWYTGAGARFDIDGRWFLVATGGYAHGADLAEGSLEAGARFGELRLGLEGFVNRPADIGPWTAASGLTSTIGAWFEGDDFLDPYFESGVRAWIGAPIAGGTGRLTVATAEHEIATLSINPIGETPARPIRAIEEGRDTRVTADWNRQLVPLIGSKVRVDLRADVAATGDFSYTRWIAGLTAVPTEPDASWGWEGRGGVGVVTGDVPVQGRLLIGGRGTLPGYGFRTIAAESTGFANVAVMRTLISPWLRVRAIGAIGWAMSDAGPDSDSLDASVGGGVSIVYDLIRVDAVRGLGDDGYWEWIVSVNPQFRAPL